MSRYDELHEKYDKILSTKAGTRYERLTAMVFKILDEKKVVIHDVALVGESDVPHQIDVKISTEGLERHLLIECKDFDVSGDKTDLGIVRNFWAVVEDTKAHEARIVTCNGFTAQAAKFAKAKGIKLAVLRNVEEADWKGRIREIRLRLIALSPANAQLGIILSEADKSASPEAYKALTERQGFHVGEPVFLVKGTERQQINDFLTERMSAAFPVSDDKKAMQIEVPSDGWEIEIEGKQIGFTSFKMTYEFAQHETETTITSSRVAELIIAGLGDSDVFIFGDQLERRKIDPDTGEVL